VAATATAVGLAAAAVAAVSAAVALRTKACLSTSSDFQKLMDLSHKNRTSRLSHRLVRAVTVVFPETPCRRKIGEDPTDDGSEGESSFLPLLTATMPLALTFIAMVSILLSC
jgi:hypothetical protein